jgi:hypothetical protein
MTCKTWVEFVKKYAKDHKISYRDALKKAGPEWEEQRVKCVTKSGKKPKPKGKKGAKKGGKKGGKKGAKKGIKKAKLAPMPVVAELPKTLTKSRVAKAQITKAKNRAERETKKVRTEIKKKREAKKKLLKDIQKATNKAKKEAMKAGKTDVFIEAQKRILDAIKDF